MNSNKMLILVLLLLVTSLTVLLSNYDFDHGTNMKDNNETLSLLWTDTSQIDMRLTTLVLAVIFFVSVQATINLGEKEAEE